jgi:hypothetical protein
MKWSELPKEYQELEKGFPTIAILNMNQNDISFRFAWDKTNQGTEFWLKCSQAQSISELPEIPSEPIDEKLELLKEIQEYFERKENQRSMPLWLSVRIEKVINK